MWYAAAILFERIHPQSLKIPDDPLWEESIILVNASSGEEATAKASALGRQQEVSYAAISTETVEWRFVEVMDVHELLDEPTREGAEVFSRLLRERPRPRTVTG